MSIRQSIGRALPLFLVTTLRSLEHSIKSLGQQSRGSPDVFGEIHDRNKWGSVASVSGPGSEDRETMEIRELLPSLLQRYQIKSMLDAPCGDFSWMSKVDLGSCDYVGAEVVPKLVLTNKEKYERAGRKFISADLTKDSLPKVDLILCRDCLIHLSFKDAAAVLNNFLMSGSRYLLVTTDPSVQANRPIKTGGFRPLNLQLPPFRLPKPLELHRDRFPTEEGANLIDPNKHIGLFDLTA
jgi:hypothetical protein